MARYAKTVKGQMYGHMHEDSFVMIKNKAKQLRSVLHVNPSLTTDSQRHPTFRVYTMDATTYDLLDYEDYRMNLTQSNLAGKPVWYRSYNFTQYYHVPDLSVASYDLITKRFLV